MYQVFERINTSGRTLVPQEIRNCVYQGDFNTLLISLNNDKNWRSLFGTDKPDPRMRDIEFILRFFALSSKHWSLQNTVAISLKKYLNQFMGNSETENEQFLAASSADFLNAIKFIAEHFGKEAFQNISPSDPSKSTGKFNPTIYDSIIVATHTALKFKGEIDVSNLATKRISLLANENFQNLTRVRTTNEDRIAQRITLALHHLFGLNYE